MSRWWAQSRPPSSCAINSRCDRRVEYGAQKRHRAVLVEGFVAVATFRRLDTRWAPGHTRAGGDHLERCREVTIRRGVSELRDAGTAGIAVVHEHRGCV